MRSLVSAVRRLRPMVFAIAATLCAAALVLYYQHRALSTLDSQTGIILRQMAEQAASDIAVEARRTLDGPVFETLTAVNHPELRAGRLDLVAREFQEGLDAYPHVDRFFVWSAETEAEAPGEAMFFEPRRTRTGRRRRRGDGVRITGDPAVAAVRARPRARPRDHRARPPLRARAAHLRRREGRRARRGCRRCCGCSGPTPGASRTSRSSASSSIPRRAASGCSTRSTSAASRRCWRGAAATRRSACASSTIAARSCTASRAVRAGRRPRRCRCCSIRSIACRRGSSGAVAPRAVAHRGQRRHHEPRRQRQQRLLADGPVGAADAGGARPDRARQPAARRSHAACRPTSSRTSRTS